MRILLMCHFPLTGSGSGVYTLNVAHALAKQGHEVRIIVPENQPPEKYDAFGVHPVYFTGPDGIHPDIATCGAMGFDVLDFNFPCFTTHPRSVQTFYDMTDEQLEDYEAAFRAALEFEIENFHPDVIHCGHAWLQPAYAADYGIPLIVTVHGTDLIGYEKIVDTHDESAKLFKDAAKKALESAAAIITISKENNQLVRRLFPEQVDKCHLILNGYNADVFYPQPTTIAEALEQFDIDVESDFDDFAHLVSFAGKFAHFKGIDVLLKGAAGFLRPDTALVLAGDGELFDEMSALANELGLENVFFVHNQPHAALRRLYSAADLSLLTSRKEPFGLVIIEAMACGAPVVGSDDGGAVDIVTPEVGLLFESENPADLAEKVNEVLDGKKKFDREVVAEYAKKNFSQDESIEQLVDIYKEACVTTGRP